MRKTTKKTIILICGFIFAIFYCEYMVHYEIIAQCEWPVVVTNYHRSVIRAFILADIHMLGPRKGYWLDKWRREWQMHRSYQAILSIHRPDLIFILGDIFDEGEWSNDRQFDEYVKRFYKLFYRPGGTPMYIVAGNHDVGFHSQSRRGANERFSEQFDAPPVNIVTVKNNHFILINSLAMHGDSCSLCVEARKSVKKISNKLRCAADGHCGDIESPIHSYSRPIIMQHFPLYRKSDSVCTEPDSAPPKERDIPFRSKIDCLSKDSTNFLVRHLKPRAVFGGHTHHGCVVHHHFKNESVKFVEYSVPSFSWINRRDPKYMLVTIAPDTYAVNKCALSQETTIIVCAVMFIFAAIYIVGQIYSDVSKYVIKLRTGYSELISFMSSSNVQ